MNWTKITDSVKSLPPQGEWILIAMPREAGAVVEASYIGMPYGDHAFVARGGRTFYSSEYSGRVIAWMHKPKYPKELE